MASPPTSTHALLFASIEEVRAYFAQNGLCKASGPQPPPFAPSPPRAPTCAVAMELLLVLDRSGSIRHSMPTLLSFARDLASDFEIGSSLTRVGVVQFNGDAEVLLSLSDSAAAARRGVRRPSRTASRWRWGC